MPEFPIINTFMIPGTGREYIDGRNVSPADYQTAFDLWCDFARARLKTLPGAFDVCGAGPNGTVRLNHDLRALDRARIARPGLTADEFIAEGGYRLFETDALPDASEVFMCVRDRNGWVGGLPFTNIKIEFEDRNRIEASFFVAVATPPPGRMTSAEANALGVRFLLSTTLGLADGRDLLFNQFDYTLPKKFEAEFRADARIQADLAAISAEGFERKGGLGSADPDRKLTFRRAGVRTQPDENEPPILDRGEPDPTVRPVGAVVSEEPVGGGGKPRPR